MNRFEKVIVDADICIHLAKYGKVNAIRCILGNIAEKVYIHEYILDVELLSNTSAGKIREMEKEGRIQVLSPLLHLSDVEKANYEATCEMLADAVGVSMDEERCRHKGEVVSIAIAKALGIPVFLSNERGLQKEIDECINTGMDDIQVFRIRDVILWIRENPECRLTRKDAKYIWLLSFDKLKCDFYKKEFDKILWPK